MVLLSLLFSYFFILLLSFHPWFVVGWLFSADMVVRSIGNSLMVILPDLLGKKITAWFDLVRPLIAFKFQTVSSTMLGGEEGEDFNGEYVIL